MMRRACLLLFVLLAPALTPLAGAAPVVDPLIGVRGTLSSSPAITDPTLQPFVDCAPIIGEVLPASYSCAPYDTLGMDIFSLTLQFFDEQKNPFPFGALSLDFANSFFDTMQFVDDFTVRLSNDVIEVVETFRVAAVADPWPFTGLVIFTAAGPGPNDVAASWVSVLAVNDVTNVPEPAAMLLLGAGVVAAGSRRLRRTRPPS